MSNLFPKPEIKISPYYSDIMQLHIMKRIPLQKLLFLFKYSYTVFSKFLSSMVSYLSDYMGKIYEHSSYT